MNSNKLAMKGISILSVYNRYVGGPESIPIHTRYNAAGGCSFRDSLSPGF